MRDHSQLYFTTSRQNCFLSLLLSSLIPYFSLSLSSLSLFSPRLSINLTCTYNVQKLYLEQNGVLMSRDNNSKQMVTPLKVNSIQHHYLKIGRKKYRTSVHFNILFVHCSSVIHPFIYPSIHFQVESKQQTVVQGRIFNINSQRLRTGSHLKLSVNFNEDTISLSKEVLNQFKELV